MSISQELHPVKISYINISEIKIHCLDISHEKLEDIINNLYLKKLTKLVVNTDELSSNMLNHILYNLRLCPNLRRLDLKSKYIGYDSIKYFLELLNYNKSIKYLTISNIDINDKFIESFVLFLKYNKTLIELNIIAKYLTTVTSNTLCKVLTMNYTLIKLDLNNGSYKYAMPPKIESLIKRNKKYQTYIKIKKSISRKTRNTRYWYILRMF